MQSFSIDEGYMSNFLEQQGTSIDSNKQLRLKNLRYGKLYVAYINTALVESGEQYNEFSDIECNSQYRETGFNNRMPVILSEEEEAMLYDKYY